MPVKYDKAPDEDVMEGRDLKSDSFKLASSFMRGGPLGLAAQGVSQATDTIGRAMNAAAYKAGGAVTDVGANLGLPPEVSAGLGFGANVGIQAIPTVLGGLGGKAAGQPIMEHEAKRLMRSALKPDKAMQRKMMPGTNMSEGEAAIQTMLDDGINVSRGGLAKMRDKVSDLNAQISAAITSSSGKTVDKGEVLKAIDALKAKAVKQAAPQEDLAAIDKIAERFRSHPLFQTPTPTGRMTAQQYQQMLKGGGAINDIPVPLAQEIKQGTYKALGDKSYGEIKTAEVEAQKAIARALKEEISKAVPDVAPLNAAESRLINAGKVLENRLATEGNKNPAGLAWLATQPLAAAGFLVDRSAFLKGLLARGMYSGRGVLPTTAGAGAGGLLGPLYLDDQGQ